MVRSRRSLIGVGPPRRGHSPRATNTSRWLPRPLAQSTLCSANRPPRQKATAASATPSTGAPRGGTSPPGGRPRRGSPARPSPGRRRGGPVDDGVLDVLGQIVQRDLLAPPDVVAEPVVAGGHADQLVVVGVPVDPGQRGADAQLDTAHRITFAADRGPLGPAQVELGLAQDLDEELLLGFEVPVEDALADAEPRDQVGDRRVVVAALGEASSGVVDQLVAPLPSPGRELLGHVGGQRYRTT